MMLQDIIGKAINPALALLPPRMDTQRARVMLLAIGLQESRFMHRWQVLADGSKGPARGFWQFELGTQASHGGVWGPFQHPATEALLSQLCVGRACAFSARAIWTAIETDDVLAAGLARLLLAADPKPLPEMTDTDGAWALYLRTWRPGKPKPDTWPLLHAQAVEAVTNLQGAPE